MLVDLTHTHASTIMLCKTVELFCSRKPWLIIEARLICEKRFHIRSIDNETLASISKHWERVLQTSARTEIDQIARRRTALFTVTGSLFFASKPFSCVLSTFLSSCAYRCSIAVVLILNALVAIGTRQKLT